jgi:4-alpha-glucanotransferase
VLWFEQDAKKRFRGPEEYPERALATANTHDLATVAGFWTGRDVTLREENGLLGTRRAAATAHKERARDRAALLKLLVEQGLLPEGVEPEDVGDLELRNAVHAFLRRTRSWLVGLSLDDLTGETDAVNLPGVSPDKYPSWTRKQSMTLEEIRTSAAVRYALGVERAWSRESDPGESPSGD